MTQMSKTQRTAILDFHNGCTAKGYSLIASARTLAVMVREGWAVYPTLVTPQVARLAKVRTAYVTTAGLVAAGVDMGAIEDDAAAEHRARTAVANGTARRAPATLERSVEQAR